MFWWQVDKNYESYEMCGRKSVGENGDQKWGLMSKTCSKYNSNNAEKLL